MGQKPSASSRKQPSRAAMSGVAVKTSIGGGAASTQHELLEQEDQFIDVDLINVNQAILNQAKIGATVEVQGFLVLTQKGIIGEIPHALRHKIEASNYKTGIVLSIDKPRVRLSNK